MKKLLKLGIAAAVVVAMIAPGQVEAQVENNFNGPYSGGSSFTFDAFVDLSWSGGTWTLLVTNGTGLTGDVLTRIGLSNVPASWSFDASNTGVVAGSAGSWTFEGNGGLNTGTNIAELVFDFTSNRGVNGGLEDGQTAAFTFDADYSELVGFAMHSQSGPESCSSKFALWWNEDGSQGQNDLGTGDGSCVSVPEPGTSALMAFGLLGLGFVAVRRRSLAELLSSDA